MHGYIGFVVFPSTVLLLVLAAQRSNSRYENLAIKTAGSGWSTTVLVAVLVTLRARAPVISGSGYRLYLVFDR